MCGSRHPSLTGQETSVKKTIAALGCSALTAGLLAGVADTATAGAQRPAPLSPTTIATRALDANRAAVRAGTADTFTAVRADRDADGDSHVRYHRTYRGLRVLGGDIVVHTSA